MMLRPCTTRFSERNLRLRILHPASKATEFYGTHTPPQGPRSAGVWDSTLQSQSEDELKHTMIVRGK